MFVYEYQAKSGTLQMGDAGWERAFPVTDGRAPELIEPPPVEPAVPMT